MAGAGAVALLSLWGGAPERPAALVARLLVVATVAQVALSLVELLGQPRDGRGHQGRPDPHAGPLRPGRTGV